MRTKSAFSNAEQRGFALQLMDNPFWLELLDMMEKEATDTCIIHLQYNAAVGSEAAAEVRAIRKIRETIQKKALEASRVMT